MLSLSSPTAAGEILLEEKSVETKAGGEEEITAIEEAVTLETEEGTSRAPFLISWILTFAFAALTVLIAMELIKKTREVDQIYKETNVSAKNILADLVLLASSPAIRWPVIINKI